MKNNRFICLVALGIVTTCGAVESRVLVKETRSWDATTLPCYPAGQPEVTLLHITIPPKTKLDLHKHPVINVGYMLKGSLTVISEQGDTLVLNEGDSLVELVGTAHYGENKGNEPAVILVFYAGIEGAPITVKCKDADQPVQQKKNATAAHTKPEKNS